MVVVVDTSCRALLGLCLMSIDAHVCKYLRYKFKWYCGVFKSPFIKSKPLLVFMVETNVIQTDISDYFYFCSFAVTVISYPLVLLNFILNGTRTLNSVKEIFRNATREIPSWFFQYDFTIHELRIIWIFTVVIIKTGSQYTSFKETKTIIRAQNLHSRFIVLKYKKNNNK